MIRRALGYLFAICAVVIPASSATLTTYTTIASFNSALSSAATLIDFNSLGTDYSTYATSSGLTIGGVNFVGVNGAGYNLSTQQPGAGPNDWGSSTYLLLPYYFASASYLSVTLPSNTTAVAFDLATMSPPGGSFTITIAGQAITLNTSDFPAHTFFGATSDTALTTIQIAVNGVDPSTHLGPHPVLDNFMSGTANVQTQADTPEVATFVLIGTGLMLMRYRLRRPHLSSAHGLA